MTTTAVARAKIQPNLPADLKEDLSADIIQIKNRIGAPSGDFVSVTRNKTFRLPGADNEAPTITGVIVDWVNSYQFYPGKYDPKNIQPPVCAALGLLAKEMKPFEKAPQRQHDKCDKCPKNQWGSDGKGKACKNQYLIALADPEDPTLPLIYVKVPPMGIKNFDKFVRTIANAGGEIPHPISAITTLSLDPSVDYPLLQFTLTAPNPDVAAYAARRKEARTRLLTEPEMPAPAAA